MVRLGILVVLSGCFHQIRAQQLDAGLDHQAEYRETEEEFLVTQLNLADERTLIHSGLLSSIQANEILSYRAEYGDFLSPYELQGLSTLNLKTIRDLLRHFELEDQPLDYYNPRSTMNKGRNNTNYLILQVRYRPEKKRGQLEKLFQASGPAVMTKIRYELPTGLHLGISLENDEGEPINWQPAKGIFGPDYVSFYLHNKTQAKIHWILGNYQFGFGQGLVARTGFGLGKGAETTTGMVASSGGIYPYTSLRESGSIRGISAHFQPKKHWDLFAGSGFTSHDATIYDSAYFYSFQETGFHRTESEISKRGAVNDRVLFSLLRFHPDPRSVLGIGYVRNTLSIPRHQQASFYDHRSWAGKKHENLSLMWESSGKGIFYWIEIATSQWQRLAFQTGLLMRLTNSMATSLIIRNYEEGYHSFYGSTLSEKSGSPENERGVYWGLEYQPDRRWKINGYIDLFQFPAGRASVYSPGQGAEFMLRAEFCPSKTQTLLLRVQQEIKPVNDPEWPLKHAMDQRIRQALIHMSIKLNRTLEFRGRIQWKNVLQTEIKNGSSLYVEGIQSWPVLSMSARIAMFQAEDYVARLFAFERDVWGKFSLPSYYGTGVRYYLLLRWKISKNTDLWFRLARTGYIDRSVQGSGADQINGSHRTDITWQMKIKL